MGPSTYVAVHEMINSTVRSSQRGQRRCFDVVGSLGRRRLRIHEPGQNDTPHLTRTISLDLGFESQ